MSFTYKTFGMVSCSRIGEIWGGQSAVSIV